MRAGSPLTNLMNIFGIGNIADGVKMHEEVNQNYINDFSQKNSHLGQIDHFGSKNDALSQF